jgi:hypothetical protein
MPPMDERAGSAARRAGEVVHAGVTQKSPAKLAGVLRTAQWLGTAPVPV